MWAEYDLLFNYIITNWPSIVVGDPTIHPIIQEIYLSLGPSLTVVILSILVRMWVWDRSIGLWLWGVFQPNQQIKCLFAQFVRPTDHSEQRSMWLLSAEALSLVFVFTGLKSAECLQMWVEPAARRQRSSPEPGTSPEMSPEPRVSPVRPPRGPGAPLAARELRTGDLSCIVWSPPWQFDWSDHLFIIV